MFGKILKKKKCLSHRTLSSTEKTIGVGWQFQKSALLYQKKKLGKLFGKGGGIGQH